MLLWGGRPGRRFNHLPCWFHSKSAPNPLHPTLPHSHSHPPSTNIAHYIQTHFTRLHFNSAGGSQAVNPCDGGQQSIYLRIKLRET